MLKPVRLIPRFHTSSPGAQHSPALTFDSAGDLHVAWIEQAELGAPSRLWYARGRTGQ